MTRSIYDQDTGKETTDDLDHFTLWKALITVKAAQPLSIQFGVDNIFNFTDPETFATFSPGRTIFVSARFSL
jgi:outer membrane receptor protein involved in Fe transport